MRLAFVASRSRAPDADVYMALRFARFFRCRVEDLFSAADPQTFSVKTARSIRAGARVVVARIGTEWTAHKLPT
jgi:hypothetical protein